MSHRSSGRSRLSLALCAVAGIAAYTLPAEQAAAETWEYCVRNVGQGNQSFGLNMIPGKYGFITAPVTNGRRCTTLLSVDHTANKAVLDGRMKRDGNEIDVHLTMTGMHACKGKDVNGWLGGWEVLNGEAPVPPGQNALPWQCFDSIAGTIGGQGQALNQAISNTPAVGALRFKDNASLDLGGFTLNVGSHKSWLLGMKLYDGKLLDPQREFEIVGCPATGAEDAGDPSIPGTEGRADCVVHWYGDDTLVTTFTNEPDLRGKLLVEGLYAIPDPRAHCGGDETGWGAHNSPDGDYILSKIPANTTRPQDGIRITLSPDTGAIDIPWFMCGIAPQGGKPFVRLVNIDADFLSTATHPDFRDIINSVVTHDADGGALGESDGPVNSDYQCDPATSNGDKDPIVAWLPRTEEIPIYGVSPAGIVQKTRQVRDVTAGCGSTRGGTSTRSYLLANLRHVGALDEAQLRTVIAQEISALDITLRQSNVCLEAPEGVATGLFSNWQSYPGAPAGLATDPKSFLRHVRDSFKAGDYEVVVQQLQWLLGELSDAPGDLGTLYSAFDTCYYKNGKLWNLSDFPALEGQYPTYPLNPGFTPRNFRGDLEAQAEHVIWNIEQKLVPVAAP